MKFVKNINFYKENVRYYYLNIKKVQKLLILCLLFAFFAAKFKKTPFKKKSFGKFSHVLPTIFCWPNFNNNLLKKAIKINSITLKIFPNNNQMATARLKFSICFFASCSDSCPRENSLSSIIMEYYDDGGTVRSACIALIVPQSTLAHSSSDRRLIVKSEKY